MSEFFEKDVRTINEHIKNIFSDNELPEDSTIRNFRIVRLEGKLQVQRHIDHYTLDQTVFGAPAYSTVESKVAHLLYFVVKNHPFADGNKRSDAFLFVDFLHRNQRLFNQERHPVINDTGLAALTLLVAESDPKQKEVLIRLIMHMLSAKQTR